MAAWSRRRTSSPPCSSASSPLGVVSVLWIVVGFSLSFGDSLGGIVGNPLTYFMFQGVSEATDPRLVADDSAAALRAVPVEVRDHHAGAHHRRLRGAGALRAPTCCSSRCSRCSFTRRSRIGPGIPTASSASGACSISPAAPWCTCRRDWRRWPARTSSDAGRATWPARRTCPRTSRSSFSAPACCGSAGSASTPARRWRPTPPRCSRSPPRTPPRRRR